LNHEHFQRYLLQRFPGRYTSLSRFQRLVGGFQKETILADGVLADGSIEHMVIRAEKPDRFVRFTASAIVDEHAIVQLMRSSGIPVAEPLWLEADETVLGRRFMASRRVSGHNVGDAMGSATVYPAELTRSFIETLVRIHALPHDEAVAATQLNMWMHSRSLADNTLQEIRAWRDQIWLDRAPPSPALARLLDWLEANVPPDEGDLCVVHNDYGPHNVLVENNRVQAVLDWEICRIGDPAEDLSFLLQCCGASMQPDAAIELYQSLSGRTISAYRLKYFDVMSCAKVIVSTMSATTMYQATDPALIDWCQMPLLWHAPYQRQVEEKIAAAEAARNSKK
jgi:aminoglycoside phosphotransferase (APT) family kinase protein